MLLGCLEGYAKNPKNEDLDKKLDTSVRGQKRQEQCLIQQQMRKKVRNFEDDKYSCQYCAGKDDPCIRIQTVTDTPTEFNPQYAGDADTNRTPGMSSETRKKAWRSSVSQPSVAVWKNPESKKGRINRVVCSTHAANGQQPKPVSPYWHRQQLIRQQRYVRPAAKTKTNALRVNDDHDALEDRREVNFFLKLHQEELELKYSLLNRHSRTTRTNR
ncbi:MAG: hypothetical protein Q9226_000815, partial [Calogaya cf. arnoldii]